MTNLKQAKEAVRDRVWRLLEAEGAVPDGSYGKIPSFRGADHTAELLASLDVWKRARTVKANPDWAQLPIRIRALEDGKLLYMAVPRMASLQPFYLLDPAALDLPADQAAEKKGAAQIADPDIDTFIAILAKDPLLVKRLLTEHVSDTDGRFRVCGDHARGAHPQWPCRLYCCASLAWQRIPAAAKAVVRFG